MYGTCLPQVLNMAILLGSLALTACGGGEALPGPEAGAAVRSSAPVAPPWESGPARTEQTKEEALSFTRTHKEH